MDVERLPVAYPLEWPDEPRPPRRWRWVWLAAFAIAGATAILIASGVREGPQVLDPEQTSR